MLSCVDVCHSPSFQGSLPIVPLQMLPQEVPGSVCCVLEYPLFLSHSQDVEQPPSVSGLEAF